MTDSTDLVTKWYSGGELVTVTTQRREGESLADQQARHDRAVAYWKKRLPEG